MKATEAANDLLQKALYNDVDQILALVNAVGAPMLEGGHWALTDVKRIQKQVFELVRIRNNLAIMLHQLEIADPRQFNLFNDARPGDFE